MQAGARIFVAEPLEMIGRAIIRALMRRGLGDRVLDARNLDLCDGGAVEQFFAAAQPTHVFLAAGKKGGIQANQRFPADLMLHNLRANTNVIEAALRHGVTKLLYLGSSCMYPRDCPQPMAESSLFTGPLEPTSTAYAVSKLAGLQLCEAIQRQHGRPFIAAIPTNIYGPHDHFDPDNAHVIGALIHKIAAARRDGQAEVHLWGTGEPRRQFLYSDDLGEACAFLMDHYAGPEPINIGGGDDVSIRELAERIRAILAYPGNLRFDASKPDGAPRKALDGQRLAQMGWKALLGLDEGLRRTCDWYMEHQ